MWREFWKCSRTGYFTETEMRYGGECASGQELRLWLPRPTLLRRMFPLSKAAA
jgi:hypothetical protein